MNKKNINIILLILLLINLTIVVAVIHNFNDTNKTIFVEFSRNYMNGNIEMPNDSINNIEHIQLYQNHNVYNEKFNVTNMFPGDIETKYYCVSVTYKDDITIKYSAEIESDYKQLEDVFNLKIKLINNDEILYNGPIKNLPETVDYSTSSNESISEDFCYEITASLDTNVGNEYQNKTAIIDFKWLVDNENLENESNPSTVDNIVFWVSLAIVSSILLLLILLTLKNERKRLK